MELADGLRHAREHHQGVLTTIRANGRPQLSNILYSAGSGEVVRISVTDDRAKTKNLRRDPRASLYVPGETFWAYAVLEGTAELGPVAATPDDAAVEELVGLYRELQGEHPDWEAYRASMVEQQRLVVRLRPERAYGILGG